MARLVGAKCPHCGAAMRLDRAAEFVTCGYCSTSSFIQRQGQPTPQLPPGQRVVVAPARGPNVAALVAGVAVALLVCGSSAAMYLWQRPAHGLDATQRSSPFATSAPATTASEVAYSVSAARLPLLADVNGDGARDPVVVVSGYENGASRTHVTAFDAQNGRSLWRTEELGRNAHQLRNTIAAGTLLVADDAGQLTGYQLSNGQKLWSSSLGDKLERYCVAPGTTRARLVLEDERSVDLEVSTGAQHAVAGKPECRPALADERPRQRGHPRTWKSELMPEQVESYGCGRTRFMGDYNFVLEDRCASRIKVDTEKAASFWPSSIGRHGAGWLLVGHKSPGSRVPMVGFALPGKLAWSSVVPSGNPLSFREGAPDKLAWSGDVVVLPYAQRTGSEARTTAFDIASGKRLWDIALPKGFAPDKLVSSEDTAYLVGSSQMLALSLSGGVTRFHAGPKP